MNAHMFESLPEAGHLEVVSVQNVAQNFNTLFLQLLYDLKKTERGAVILSHSIPIQFHSVIVIYSVKYVLTYM